MKLEWYIRVIPTAIVWALGGLYVFFVDVDAADGDFLGAFIHVVWWIATLIGVIGGLAITILAGDDIAGFIQDMKKESDE